MTDSAGNSGWQAAGDVFLDSSGDVVLRQGRLVLYDGYYPQACCEPCVQPYQVPGMPRQRLQVKGLENLVIPSGYQSPGENAVAWDGTLEFNDIFYKMPDTAGKLVGANGAVTLVYPQNYYIWQPNNYGQGPHFWQGIQCAVYWNWGGEIDPSGQQRWSLAILALSTAPQPYPNGQARILWLGYKCGCNGPAGIYHRATDPTRPHGDATAPDTLRVCGVTSVVPPENLTAGSNSATLVIKTNCDDLAWTAESSEPWIAVSPPGSGTGSATVAFTTQANHDVVSRAGYIEILGVAGSIVQPGCSVILEPARVDFPLAGGNVTVSLTTLDPECRWEFAGIPDWLTLTPTSGSGNATLTLAVQPNAGLAAQVQLALGDGTATLEVTREGLCPDCPPNLQNLPLTLTLTISGLAGCDGPEDGVYTLSQMYASEWLESESRWVLYCGHDNQGQACWYLDYCGPGSDGLSFVRPFGCDCRTTPVGNFTYESGSCGATGLIAQVAMP